MEGAAVHAEQRQTTHTNDGGAPWNDEGAPQNDGGTHRNDRGFGGPNRMTANHTPTHNRGAEGGNESRKQEEAGQLQPSLRQQPTSSKSNKKHPNTFAFIFLFFCYVPDTPPIKNAAVATVSHDRGTHEHNTPHHNGDDPHDRSRREPLSTTAAAMTHARRWTGTQHPSARL